MVSKRSIRGGIITKIKTSSGKAKARRLQDKVRDGVRETFDLSEHDVNSAIMGESGMDIKLSAEARDRFPYAVEAKAYKRIALFQWWKQTVDNAKEEGLTPLLVFKQDRAQPLVALTLEEFLRILSHVDKLERK